MKREDVELFVFKPVSFFYSESMVRFQAEFQHKLLANDWWRLLDIETILARGLTQPVTRVTLDKQTSLFIDLGILWGYSINTGATRKGKLQSHFPVKRVVMSLVGVSEHRWKRNNWGLCNKTAVAAVWPLLGGLALKIMVAYLFYAW